MIKNEVRCASCGSYDIKFDAVAVWNVKRQVFELAGVLDNNWCEPCSASFDDSGMPEWTQHESSN